MQQIIIYTKWISRHFLLIVGLIVSLIPTLGCGVGEYERRMDQRLSELRSNPEPQPDDTSSEDDEGF